jgi:probable 2-oxoglutarate dehydrogenase E1 component DHKTD1
VADLDPLAIQQKLDVPELDPARYGIPEKGQTFNLTGICMETLSLTHCIGIVHLGKKGDPSMPREKAPIEQVLAHLRKTYCGKIAYEFRHIPVLKSLCELG